MKDNNKQKRAYVSLTYLFYYEPSDLDLDEETISKKVFEYFVDRQINNFIETVNEATNGEMPNDINVDIMGEFEE